MILQSIHLRKIGKDTARQQNVYVPKYASDKRVLKKHRDVRSCILRIQSIIFKESTSYNLNNFKSENTELPINSTRTKPSQVSKLTFKLFIHRLLAQILQLQLYLIIFCNSMGQRDAHGNFCMTEWGITG